MPDHFHVHLYGPDRGPLASSFEEASERLERLENLYLEPDGSFVWTRDGGNQQIYGMLYDAGGRLQYVELRGHFARETWRSVVAAIGGGGSKMSVVILETGQLQDLQSFEQLGWPPA